MKIEVAVPTYRPGADFAKLLRRLSCQSVKPSMVRVANTDESGWDPAYLSLFPDMQVFHISPEEFDHGGTRRLLADRSKADVLVFMTQDAIPADPYLLERLSAPFRVDPLAGVAFARQLPKEDCRLAEKYYREYNYPARSYMREQKDLPRYGVKTFFCSNVCAAYRMEAYRAAGGFPERAIFNEDMVLCEKLLAMGEKVFYEADARVFHSHNYTCRQQFHRNFDLGVSHACFPEVFQKTHSEGEGIRMVMRNTRRLLMGWHCQEAAFLWAESAARYAGYLLGKKYASLPNGLVRRLSMNPGYWDATQF